MTNVLIQTLGGLGLFILGMKMMTDGLQMAAGKRIKTILGAVSSNRIIGFITGAGITAMIQSSSATTVMLIGFVSAGLMTFQQAVSVTLGANVGTTMTAQLIAFKLTSAALPAIAIGVIMKFFTQQKKFRYWGEVILGFGLLFFGMDVMKHGLSPIKDDPVFIEFFTKFDPSSIKGLLLSVMVGAALTVMVQSSSATIGLTMTLATQGLLTFPGAMALVLGENIGTTITAQLATISSNNVNAYRTANAHTMFNVLGVFLMLLIFPVFTKLVVFLTGHLGAGPVDAVVNGESVNISRYIANGHTLFNVLNACFFLIFLPWLIKVAILISPKAKADEDFFRLPNFGSRLIDTPIAAMAEARSEIRRMAGAAISTFNETVERLEDRDVKKLSAWQKNEHFLDDMQREITAYLNRISQSDVGDEGAREISSMMRMTNNIERIGDSVENIAQAAEKLIEEKLTFSAKAMEDIKIISAKVMEFLQLVSEGMYRHDQSFMQLAQTIEDTIDDMREEMRDNHICRLRGEECCIESGLIFVNLLTNFEKIGDYCYNIAEAVVGLK